MSTYRDIRRATAEKLAKPADGQQRLQGCVIPAHIRARLESIRIACELSVAERKALEREPGQPQEDDDQ